MARKKRLSLGVPEGGEKSPSPRTNGGNEMKQGSMETVSGLVRLGGDVRNEVPINNITPAQLVVLAGIHGGDSSLRNLSVTGAVTRTSAQEKRRLIAKFPRYMQMIESMFPGLRPVLPMTLKEAQSLLSSADPDELEDEPDLLAS